MFLKGLELSKDQFRKQLEENDDFRRECLEQISELFNLFDANNDQRVDAGEVMRTLRSFNVYKSEKECLEMIKAHSEGAAHVNKSQFNKMMLPIMIDELLAKKDNVQDLRRIFCEADVDNSGFLDVGELYAAVRRLGADLTEDELASLMAEIDVDRDGVIDIDEFVALMTTGDQIEMGQDAARAFMQIQKARRLTPTDFVKLFKAMPASFVPSFINELWKAPRCLPSSVFKAQVDPATMLWKDVREYRSDIDGDILAEFNPKNLAKPYMRPMASSVAAEIRIVNAQGVPIPRNENGFQDDFIVKRAVNIGIQYTPPSQGDFKAAPLPTFIHNAIQVPANWNVENEDIWEFHEDHLSEVLFRTTKRDRLERGKTRIIFELVVHVR